MKTVEHFSEDGNTKIGQYEDIDFQATFKNAGLWVGKRNKDNLLRANQNYGVSSKNAKDHIDVIERVSASYEALHQSC